MGDNAEKQSTISSDAIAAELKAMREQIAALTSELRAKKRRGSRRATAVVRKVAEAVTKPTELELAKMRRKLFK